MQGFKICGNKGFHMTFNNGVTVSVQFGGGNYCGNYDQPKERYTEGQKSFDAEIAIFDEKGDFITEKFDGEASFGVLGYKNTKDVLKAFKWAEKYKV